MIKTIEMGKILKAARRIRRKTPTFKKISNQKEPVMVKVIIAM
jgi:hypothetical protein